MGRVEQDLSSNVTLFGALGHKDHTGQFVLGFPTITTATGNTAEPTSYQGAHYKIWSGETGVRAKVYTGPIKHEAVVAYNQTSQEAGFSFFPLSTVANNIFNPSPSPVPPNLATVDTNVPKANLTTLKSVAVADVISAFDDRVQLTLGARRQQVGIDTFSDTSGALTSSTEVSRVSPSTALVIKPWKQIALYANYIEGLESVAPAPPGTVNVGQVSLLPLPSRRKWASRATSTASAPS